MKCKKLCALIVSLGAINAKCAVVQEWNFKGDLQAASGGVALRLPDATAQSGVAFGSCASFGIANLGDPQRVVLKATGFPMPSGVVLPVSAPANGGGSRVNNWTLVMDVLFPASSDATWRALIETDEGATADGDLFVNPADGLGISDSYHGFIDAGVWHRIGFVVGEDGVVLSKYLDGVFLATQSIGARDGRWALRPGGNLTFFADNDGEVAPCFVSSVQFRDYAMSASDMAALGKPSNAGVPLPSTDVPVVVPQTIPSFINYQGMLTDSTGQAVATSDYVITFRIYDAATGGTRIWGPQVFDGSAALAGHGAKVPVVQGHFNVLLGPIDTTGASIGNAFTGANRYIELQIGTGTPISPRQQVVSAPYALAAGTAVNVVAGAIGAAQLADSSVTGAKLAPGAVTSGQLADAAVSASKLAPGAVTAAALSPDLTQVFVPAGTIVAFGGSNVPDGWLLCDGSLVSTIQKQALFKAVGYTYGGSGLNFGLPDMRGRAVIGTGKGAGLSVRTLAQKVGEETHVLNVAEIPSHAHGGITGNDSPDHSHGFGGYPFGVDYGGNNSAMNLAVAPNGFYRQTDGASTRHRHTIPAEGGGQAHNIMQPSMALNYIIKY